MMAPILESVDPPAAREHARQLGLAFQLTNFIRDLAEDYQRGRVYLPAADLECFGVRQADLAAAPATPAVAELLAFEGQPGPGPLCGRRARYRAARPSSRPCVRVALELYGGILDEVERAGYQVLGRRVRVPRHRRLGVAGRHWAAARCLAGGRLVREVVEDDRPTAARCGPGPA